MKMKLENRAKFFCEKNPGKQFPVYNKVLGEKALKIFEKLCKNFYIDSPIGNIGAISKVISNGKFLKVIDEANFSLNKYFKEVPTEIPHTLFLNYGDMSEFYEISTESLNAFFDDIYFPGADDIEIFDESCAWLFSVNHDRYLLLCKPIT